MLAKLRFVAPRLWHSHCPFAVFSHIYRIKIRQRPALPISFGAIRRIALAMPRQPILPCSPHRPTMAHRLYDLLFCTARQHSGAPSSPRAVQPCSQQRTHSAGCAPYFRRNAIKKRYYYRVIFQQLTQSFSRIFRVFCLFPTSLV